MPSNDPPDRAGAADGAASSRSEALEAELAALEAMLPREPPGARPVPADLPDGEPAAGKPAAREA